MPLPNKDKFLKEVLSQIKFPYDRQGIKEELELHIFDKVNDYMEKGYDMEKAEQLAIDDMGDATEIGMELNKQHNPIIGWVWKISTLGAKSLAALAVLVVGMHLLNALFPGSPIKDIPKESIVYKLDIDEKVKIDSRVIHFTDIIYDKNSNLSIIYEDYYTGFRRLGWSLGSIGEISDNLGNTYWNGTGSGGSGRRSKSRRTVLNFSPKADRLIIDYDQYNRQYRVEIPLPVGDDNE